MTEKKEKRRRGLFGLFSRPAAEPEPEEAPAAEAPPEEAEAAPVVDDKAANVLPAGENELYKTYCRINGMPPLSGGATFDVTMFHAAGLVPNDETRALLKSLDPRAAALMRKWLEADAEPVDAESVVMVSADKMRAYLFCFPPMFGGEDISTEGLRALLAEQQVSYGIDEETLLAAGGGRVYMRLILVASGTPVQDGRDGSVVDHYNRDTDIHLTVKWDNTIDYRDLGWLQTANEGDVICTILLPTEAVNGTNVYGNEVPGKNGRKAQVPSGTNTKLSEDGTRLTSLIDGVVTFASDRFRVDPMLIIEGDVDTAVGNIEAVGDVLVKGDLKEGFTVSATGNVTVNGGVEGAHIRAGGNVQIGLGMNGNSVGSITAVRDVFSKFFENTNVSAGGSVTCDTIINSTISSEGEVLVKTGRGAIIGGQVTALLRVAATSIGNQSNRAMEITLGNTTAYLQEKKLLEEDRQKENQEVKELEKGIRFLERQTDTPTKKQRLDEMRLQLKMRRMKQAKLEREYGLVLAREADIAKCRLQAEVLYPPLQVNMGPAFKTVRQNQYNVLMYFKDGEIQTANV